MKRTLRVAAAAAVAVVSLAAAGCGSGGESSSGTSPTVDWANNLCSATSTWTGALKDAATALKDGPYTTDALREAADSAKAATQTYVDTLDGLGRPDTPAGQEAQTEVDKLRGELESGVDDMEQAVDDASDAGGVLNAVSVVSGTLVTMGKQLQATVANLRELDPGGEIEQAIAQADACEPLRA
jgi:hypothetical protein